MDPVIAEFRANGGVAGGFFAGKPLLILNTTGAKSGEARSHALMYGTDGDDLFIIASKGGAPVHPAWYHNLVANPEVTIELGAESYRAQAIDTTGDDRDRLFDEMVKDWPFFGEYALKAGRTIPVIRLRRLSS